MRGGKKKDDDFDDAASQISDMRTDGTNARVFSSIVGAGGYIPHHKEPPRYIRTKAANKKDREFNRMFLAQELVGTRPPANRETDEKAARVTVKTAAEGRKRTETGGAIWTTEFSRDGRYLAAAGRDEVVRVWAVISTHEDRRLYEEDEAANGAGGGERLSAPVFLEKPVQEFEGHTGEILNVSWSKNNFLLSTSMDKTVRLWHVSRKECLCTFRHKELVSKVAFHPTDDRFFLAGCLDTTLRLWSIPDKAVAFSAKLPDLITAVAFSPDGRTAMAGLLSGLCYFYDTEGLKPQGQIHVRSSRGKNAKGSKITGIHAMLMPADGAGAAAREGGGDVKVLITSTDSRIRIYNLRDKSPDVKFKGHEHACGQLSASFSDDGNYVICGSEDRKAFIWSMMTGGSGGGGGGGVGGGSSGGGGGVSSGSGDKRPCESFDSSCDMVTTAVFAPTKTRQLLGSSGDPIYELCNPPPVTLMSMGESQTTLPSSESEVMAAVLAQVASAKKKAYESPAYVARSTHYDGNIVVTTDDRGVIRVFRQDCAYIKRKHESWETGSAFSKKLAAAHGVGTAASLVGRSASILTRTSASSATHSRRGSLSQMPPGLSSGPPSVAGTPHLGSSDRILSWRQGIEGNNNSGRQPPVGAGASGGGGTLTPTRSERSVSPGKCAARTPLSSVANLASEARKQPYVASSPPVTPQLGTNHAGPLFLRNGPTSPASSTFSAPRTGGGGETAAKDGMTEKGSGKDDEPPSPSFPPTPSFTFRPADDNDDHLRLDPAGASYSFWNLNKWKGIANLRNSIGGSQQAGGQQIQTRTASSGDISPGGGGASTSSTAGRDGPSSPPAEEGGRRPSLFAKSTLAHSSADDSQARSTGQTLGDDVAGHHHRRQLLPPPGDRSPHERASVVSRLSSELTSEGDDEPDEAADERIMRCDKCGGREFKARKIAAGPGAIAVRHRLVCGRCGKAVAGQDDDQAK